MGSMSVHQQAASGATPKVQPFDASEYVNESGIRVTDAEDVAAGMSAVGVALA